MRKIVANKKYDTTSAELLGSWSSPHNRGDFHYCEETLYRTKSGAFFLHGEGGPLSRWSHPCPDGMSGGEGLVPLSREDALAWAEEHLEADEVEAAFGPVAEA